VLANNMRRVMVNMDRGLKDEIKKRAKSDGRSMSKWLERVIRWYIYGDAGTEGVA
jgi:hypothetical protein